MSASEYATTQLSSSYDVGVPMLDGYELDIVCDDQRIRVERLASDSVWGVPLTSERITPDVLRMLHEQSSNLPGATALRLDLATIGSYALFSLVDYSWMNLWRSESPITDIVVAEPGDVDAYVFSLKQNF